MATAPPAHVAGVAVGDSVGVSARSKLKLDWLWLWVHLHLLRSVVSSMF